jgi:hypothetical protein
MQPSFATLARWGALSAMLLLAVALLLQHPTVTAADWSLAQQAAGTPPAPATAPTCTVVSLGLN